MGIDIYESPFSLYCANPVNAISRRTIEVKRSLFLVMTSHSTLIAASTLRTQSWLPCLRRRPQPNPQPTSAQHPKAVHPVLQYWQSKVSVSTEYPLSFCHAGSASKVLWYLTYKLAANQSDHASGRPDSGGREHRGGHSTCISRTRAATSHATAVPRAMLSCPITLGLSIGSMVRGRPGRRRRQRLTRPPRRRR